jgi:hypothetical protein
MLLYHRKLGMFLESVMYVSEYTVVANFQERVPAKVVL